MFNEVWSIGSYAEAVLQSVRNIKNPKQNEN